MDSAKSDIASDSTEIKTEPFADRFEIQAEIGCGGMSVVYRAREILLDRIVALKILNHSALRESVTMQRFRNEAKACSALQHANIVQTLSFGIADGKQPYIVMELLQGRTLEQELREKGGLDKDKFQEIFLPVIDALIYAHAKNMVHRDLKPSNIMLIDEPDGSMQVKVVDFGIAKVIENDQGTADTQATVGLLGSPLYMSPEQCSGSRVDQRSDIYSLACVMYESIVGKPPFSGETLYETMYEHLTKSVPKLAEISGSLNIPRALFDAIIEALAKDPDKRPCDMEQFRDKVNSALSRQDRIRRPAKLASRLQSIAYFICAAALLLVVPVIFFSQKVHGPPADWKNKQQHYVGNPEEMVSIVQARFLREAGKPELALKKCQEALFRTGNAVRENHPRWLASIHVETARTFAAMNEADKAIAEFKKAIEVFDVPISTTRLAVVAELSKYLVQQGRDSDCDKLFVEALQSGENYLQGESDPALADAMFQYADLLCKRGKFKEAREYAKRALALFDGMVETRSCADAVLATSICVEANLTLGMSKEKAYEEYHKTSKELKRELKPEPELYAMHAGILERAGLYDEAKEMYELSIKHLERTKPKRRKDVEEGARSGLRRVESRK